MGAIRQVIKREQENIYKHDRACCPVIQPNRSLAHPFMHFITYIIIKSRFEIKTNTQTRKQDCTILFIYVKKKKINSGASFRFSQESRLAKQRHHAFHKHAYKNNMNNAPNIQIHKYHLNIYRLVITDEKNLYYCRIFCLS